MGAEFESIEIESSASPPEHSPAPEPASLPSGTTRATRGQRLAFIAGVLVVGGLALELFASVLAPFVAAAVLAYALDPPTTRLTRLGLRRGGAAAVMMLALIASVLLFALLLYPLLLFQIKLLATRIPQYAFLMQGWASDQLTHLQENFGSDVVNDKLRDLVSSQAASLLSLLLSTATGVVTSGFAIFNVLTLTIVTPVLGFYLLRDWPKMIGMIESWVPHRYAAIIGAQAREVDRILSAWVRGQAMCCLILAFYYASGLTAAGLDLGLIVGLSAGMLSFIPYVGSVSGGVTAIGLALAQFDDWRQLAVVIGVLIVGQILEGYVIYPRFLGDRVELPAVWVIFALFAGGAAFGFVGVMLAVPVAATIGVLTRFWLRRYLASPLYLDHACAILRTGSRRNLMALTARQLPLLIPRAQAYQAVDFIEAASNEAARTWLDRAEIWPDRRLALWGGADHGKTYLARIWAERTGAEVLDGRELAGFPFMTAPGGAAVDDADQADEAALLHLLNSGHDLGRPVLLVGRAPPARWPVALGDLASRLRAVTAVEVGAPDDELLRRLLPRWLAERGLVADKALHERLLLRLPRNPAVLREAVARLDFDALTSRVRTVTPAMVRAALAAGAADEGLSDGERPRRANLRLADRTDLCVRGIAGGLSSQFERVASGDAEAGSIR